MIPEWNEGQIKDIKINSFTMLRVQSSTRIEIVRRMADSKGTGENIDLKMDLIGD